MKQDFTSINIVLDRSGSMASVRNDTIGGLNTFIEEQKKVPGSATVSLATFSSDYTLIHNFIPIADVPVITAETYQPSGGTALLDAIARTIIATDTKLAALQEDERPSKVLFVIITDGEENVSKEFSHAKVMEMIKHRQEKCEWSIIYLGANEDAFKVSSSYGISAGNTLQMFVGANGSMGCTGPQGPMGSAGVTGFAYNAISETTSSFRRSRLTNTMDFFSEPPVDTTSATTIVAPAVDVGAVDIIDPTEKKD